MHAPRLGIAGQLGRAMTIAIQQQHYNSDTEKTADSLWTPPPKNNNNTHTSLVPPKYVRYAAQLLSCGFSATPHPRPANQSTNPSGGGSKIAVKGLWGERERERERETQGHH